MNYKMIEEFEFLISKMKNEGLHYCFKHYSSFDEIKDEKFHELRKQYLTSANELENYVKIKYEELLFSDYNGDNLEDWDNTLLDNTLLDDLDNL